MDANNLALMLLVTQFAWGGALISGGQTGPAICCFVAGLSAMYLK